VARAHLKAHPVEVGGDNRGPWVRAYMSGNDGSDWLWCAGFVTAIVAQAASLLGTATPTPGTALTSRPQSASFAMLFHTAARVTPNERASSSPECE